MPEAGYPMLELSCTAEAKEAKNPYARPGGGVAYGLDGQDYHNPKR